MTTIIKLIVKSVQQQTKFVRNIAEQLAVRWSFEVLPEFEPSWSIFFCMSNKQNIKSKAILGYVISLPELSFALKWDCKKSF